MARSRKTLPTVDEVCTRIRERRLKLGWSYAKAASAAGLASPAYVFHIENGQKVPSARVAARLAGALGLDAELLGAWARARGRGELAAALEAAATLERLLGHADVPTLPTHAATTSDPPPRASGPPLVAVPILREGADPDSATAEAIEVLDLDRRLLPPLADTARLFGFRLSAHGVRRVADTLRPGDCVLVLRGGDPPADDTPCAVRVGGRVEIARVRLQDGALHLPRSAGAHDSGGSDERIHDPARALIGPVVIAFRRWL